MRRALPIAAALALVCAQADAAPPSKAPKKPGSDVLLQADEVDYDTDNQIVTAHGHVEVDRDGRIADQRQARSMTRTATWSPPAAMSC